MPHQLGAQLVHAQRRGHHATAGVGQLQAFKQALQTAVFATTAMQGNKHPIRAIADQLLGQIISGINAIGIHTSRQQRVEHGLAGFQ